MVERVAQLSGDRARVIDDNAGTTRAITNAGHVRATRHWESLLTWQYNV